MATLEVPKLLQNHNIDAITAIFSAGVPQFYGFSAFQHPVYPTGSTATHPHPPPILLFPPPTIHLSLSQSQMFPTLTTCNSLARLTKSMYPTLFIGRFADVTEEQIDLKNLCM